MGNTRVGRMQGQFRVLQFAGPACRVVYNKQQMSGGEQQLGEWLGSMGLVGQFSSQDLQSGRTVASLLKAIDRSNKIQLQEGNSAITRVSNWNAVAEELKKVGVKLTQEEKSKIINGNHDLVFRTISRLKELHNRSSKETEINLKEVDAKKELKDAESLLELFLLAIIRNFALTPKEALSLLSNDSKYLAHILAKGLKNDFRPIDNFIADLAKQLPKITLFSKNKENELFFLRSIKPALISKSESVGEATLQLLKNYLQLYEKEERAALLREHLLGTLVLMVRRHPQLVDKIIAAILDLGEYKEDILSQFVDSCPKNDLNSLLISLWRVYRQDNKQHLLLKSPVFDRLINHANSSLKQPELSLSSLDAMIELASHDFDLFSKRCADSLMSSFKDISFSKDNEQLVFVHAISTLLKFAGEAKHPLAPILFKYLTNRLPTASDKEYDTLIYNLTQTITEIPNIPTLPILEALTQRPDLKITQLEIGIFQKILSQGTEPKSGVAIYNMASRALVEDEGLGFELGNMLAQLASTFKEEQIIIDMSAKLMKVCLAIHFANIKKLTEKRKPISYKNKLDADEATAKLKKLEMENFLRKVIQLNDKDINNTVEPLLCFSLLQIETVSKEHARGLEKIVSLLGNVHELTSKYELELNEGEQSLKQSKLKQSSNRYDSEDRTEESNNLIKSTRRVVSSHPVSLTAVSVKADAFMGLQKYSKMHQTRFLAEQAKKEVQVQKQQDRRKLKKAYERKLMVEKGLNMKSVLESELQYLFDFDSKQLYAEKNSLHLNYYSNDCEEERDAHGLENLLKRYEKTLRVYFTHYCGKKHGMNTKYFDDILDRNMFLHTSNLFKMVNEHGLSNYITMKEIQLLARKVNYKLAKDRDDPELLDFDGFKEFITQMCFTMFTRPPKDLSGHPVAEMMGELFSTLKLYAAENRISPQLFDEPEACYTNEEEAVKVLNKKLQQNPDYILPEGYKKITETRVFYDHKIYLQAMSPTYKEVYEVLDEMLFDALKFHIIEPFTREEKICKARPNIYFMERAKLAETVEIKHIPIFLKKEVAKFPIKDRATAKEAASALADIETAIELNHDQIGLKHENPIIRIKNEREEEQRRRRQNQNNKRITFDRQLKTSMEEYKQKREEIKSKEEQAKRDELQKKREDKQRREKREKELKQKLEEYSQKKKEEEELKKSQDLAKSQKEKDEADRKKKQTEQIRKKIDELKKQREQEQKQRKEKEIEQQKRKKEEEKRKFEKTQKEKKQKIEQYKQKKKGSVVEQTKVMDSEDA